jgi:hypothetical protein
MNNFFEFLQEIGFNKEQTRIEKYRIDGTSNYLVSLNYSGITWAVAIRMPAIGKDVNKFLEEKTRAVDTAEYLVKHFAQGISLTPHVCFCFRGNSVLASYDSVQEYFNFQNTLMPLIQKDQMSSHDKTKTVIGKPFPEGIDDLNNVDDAKKQQVKEYFKEFNNVYYVSKGAPASETLDDYFFDLLDHVTHSLVKLHQNTGLKIVLPIDQVITLASTVNSCLDSLSYKDIIGEDTSTIESYQKHQAKRNKNNDKEISRLIRKELILRTRKGKKIIFDVINPFELGLPNDKDYHCFTHNDPHCENFVIVKYLYSITEERHQYIDREFLNELIESLHENEKKDFYSVEYIQENSELKYRNYIDGDKNNPFVNIISPCRNNEYYYDIHLIDIDEATGINSSDSKTYLYDLILYSLSVQNLSSIKGRPIHYKKVIQKYYDLRGDSV